jgi:hypothetical protein
MYQAARNLRTVERFLLAPPLQARFKKAPVSICDISEKGARFRHDVPLENGAKGELQLSMEGLPGPLSLEAVVVWTQADPAAPGRYVSGLRTYGAPEVVHSLIAQLQVSQRTSRIEELRSSDRFHVAPSLEGMLGTQPVMIENLSARGARVEMLAPPGAGAQSTLRFAVAELPMNVAVQTRTIWSSVKAITSGGQRTYRAGVLITDQPETVRLAIGHLCEIGRAALDTQSLGLKLKILRARARQMAPSYREIEASGIPAEQYLLIQGVREELRLNPEEAMHWYRLARMIINDPSTRALAPPIAAHPDALAVWEYLERSVDPTIIGRAFELP